MTLIEKKRQVLASVDVVWDILVDWENERKYWTNERDIKIITLRDVMIEREATVGPRGFAQKTTQRIVLDPKKSMELSFHGEQLSGERTIVLVPVSKYETRLDVAWKIKLDGVPGFVEGIIENQISKVTEQALGKIAAVAESQKRGS